MQDGQQQVEKIVKLTEKALTSDSLHVQVYTLNVTAIIVIILCIKLIQNGCLCGLLYVAEDSTSQLAIHLGPLLVKYLPPQLEAFHRLASNVLVMCQWCVSGLSVVSVMCHGVIQEH